MKSFILAITGGSGSGKTYFVNRLKEYFPDRATVFSQDNYYLPREQQPRDPNGIANFDLPESIALAEFSRDVERLKSGETIELNEYTFNNPGLSPKKLIFRPNPIFLVEGLFLLHSEELSELFDLIVFVDAPDYVRLRRRLVRDQLERGYDVSDVLYRFENHVMPSYQHYIAPYKNKAHIFVNNEKDCEKAIEVLACFLKNGITKQY